MNELSSRFAQFKIRMAHITYDACQKLDDLKADINKLTPWEIKYRDRPPKFPKADLIVTGGYLNLYGPAMHGNQDLYMRQEDLKQEDLGRIAMVDQMSMMPRRGLYSI